ncbi:MAG: ATP-dependent RNA helicase HrpA [Deltaproteobacteria bacterium]|nr:ATP-dependent RNA helicase HrpA [Deltaproteobacteria bacterium]
MIKRSNSGKKAGFVHVAKVRPSAELPRLSYPDNLPITHCREKIIDAVKAHQIVVITGETGSGKTTQIPKMCIEAGRGRTGMIGCTQPRRVAAVTVAHRIAEEMGEELGRSVGYKIRFEDRSGRHPFIKVMTDGILLMETLSDPCLSAYDTLIVDEAHERSLNIDFTLGILSRLLQIRRDFKVVITSATIDTEKFSRAFGGAPIIEVSGRTYPVEVRYLASFSGERDSDDFTPADMAAQAADTILQSRENGDILIFMPTERDIRETCDLIEGRAEENLTLLPLFARLSWNDQRRIFQQMQGRKIVVATNVAETAITIPGIRYVIDTGLARIPLYNPKTRTISLPVRPISRSSADQRKGRCGRVRNGICLRLYDREDYESRPLFTPPEILRSNLAEVILRMLSLRLGDVSSFPFVDPPKPRNIRDGIDILHELGAVQRRKSNGEDASTAGLSLTPTGRRMARLPVDPRLSRMVIEAEHEGCLAEVTIIAAALSIADPRERPADREDEADRVQAVFKDPSSDFVTMLNIWRRYHQLSEEGQRRGLQRKFCREHFLSYRRMREWEDVHDQLLQILKESGGNSSMAASQNASGGAKLYSGIHRSILSGYLSNIAVKKERNIYQAAKGREVMIFPGSGLFNKGAKWIVAAEIIETSRLYARMAAHIDVDWLEELGGGLCRSTYSEAHWERNRGEVVAFEQVTLYGLVIVARRPISYGRIDPFESSRIFIRSALIEGDLKKPFAFVEHNQLLINDIAAMEAKIRRLDLLAGEEALVRFYGDRLDGIYDTRSLKKLIRERGGDDFLRMHPADVLRAEPDQAELELYPDEVNLCGGRLELDYRFKPGDPSDGVTLKIPIGFVANVPALSIDWAVPGLLREKVSYLVRGLPKEYRRKLQPLAAACEVIAAEMTVKEDEPLLSSLGKFILFRFGVEIPPAVWTSNRLPDHLKIRISVLDQEGREIASSRDLRRLTEEISIQAESSAYGEAKAFWEKDGLTRWDFGDLPARIPLGSGSVFQGFAYPGLEPTDEGVRLRLFSSEREALAQHKRGVAALYEIHFKSEIKDLRKMFSTIPRMKVWSSDFGSAALLVGALTNYVCSKLFSKNIRTENEFYSNASSSKSLIMIFGQKVLLMAEPALDSFHETLSTMKSLEKTNRNNRHAMKFLGEISKDLERLIPVNFLDRYEGERFVHLTRYLKALSIRMERGLHHLERDRLKGEKVNLFVSSLDDMIKNLPADVSEEKRLAIEEFSWMVEEFRVSVFAQELKTSIPVSRKRLEQKLQDIDRMS